MGGGGKQSTHIGTLQQALLAVVDSPDESILLQFDLIFSNQQSCKCLIIYLKIMWLVGSLHYDILLYQGQSICVCLAPLLLQWTTTHTQASSHNHVQRKGEVSQIRTLHWAFFSLEKRPFLLPKHVQCPPHNRCFRAIHSVYTPLNTIIWLLFLWSRTPFWLKWHNKYVDFLRVF